jgi:hypothetical protein
LAESARLDAGNTWLAETVDFSRAALNNRASAISRIPEVGGMSQEPSAVEQAVTRALRDNLETLQRTANELQAAVNDVVAACASNRPTNAIPAMLRAQTAAASLAASLDVLARFTAASAQPAVRVVETVAAPVAAVPTPVPAPAPPPGIPEPMVQIPTTLAVPTTGKPVEEEAPAAVEEPAAPMVEAAPAMDSSSAAAAARAAAPAFEVSALSPDEQEIHRRASRAAKVSMQDIKLLRKKDLALARENADICVRLREDLDKARKEYDRRFKAILDQPVDYFYQWCVDILADGNPALLGEYPYPSPILRK